MCPPSDRRPWTSVTYRPTTIPTHSTMYAVCPLMWQHPCISALVIFRTEFHNIRSRCRHRTILVGAYHGLRHMPAAMQAMPQAHRHCHLARYNPSMPHFQPLTYNTSPMAPPRSNPFRYITSERRCIIEPRRIIPAMHEVDQGFYSLRTMQAVHDVLWSTGRHIHQ